MSESVREKKPEFGELVGEMSPLCCGGHHSQLAARSFNYQWRRLRGERGGVKGHLLHPLLFHYTRLKCGDINENPHHYN